MKPATILIATLLATSAATQAAWIASGSVAIANQGEPIITGVVVNGAPRCDDITVFVTGTNAMPSVMGVMVDNIRYDSGDTFDAGEDDSIAALSIGQQTLDALMSGSVATVVTNDDAVTVSLIGSRAAINSAHNACRSGR